MTKVSKWRQTMIKKLGSEEAVIEYLKTIGSKGGKSIKQVDPITGRAIKGFVISGKASEAGKKGSQVRHYGKKGL